MILQFLELSNIPVPHSQLLQALLIMRIILLLPYQEHAAIRDKMPQIIRAACIRIPVLHSPNALWENFFRAHSGFN